MHVEKMKSLIIHKYRILALMLSCVTALVGDKIGSMQKQKLGAAICDNLTHALIGCFSWLAVTCSDSLTTRTLLKEVLMCGFFSSIIDLDHFICAKSVFLEDATSLHYRPFMHNTSGVLLSTVLLMVVSRTLTIRWLERLGWIFLVAFISHHIRDSNRRGFWLWPFGSTPPTPYIWYLIELAALPVMSLLLMRTTSLSEHIFENLHTSDVLPV